MARVPIVTHEIDADGTLANTLRGVGRDVFVAQNFEHMKKELPAEAPDVVVAGLGEDMMRLVPEGVDPPIVLAKPIEVTDLATTVRRALDR